MVKMRTEATSCVGGGGGGSGCGAVSQSVVDAAVAIAQLSDLTVLRQRHTAADVGTTSSTAGDRDPVSGCSSSPRTDNTQSPPRFSHIRTAVMPDAHSRVIKAVNRLDGARERHLRWNEPHQPENGVVRGKMAVSTERDSLVTARLHLDMPESGESQAAGRFVRTCKPSGRDDVEQRYYVKVSNNTVSPTLVSSVPSLFTTSNSKQQEMVIDQNRRPVLSPVLTEDCHTQPHQLKVVSSHDRKNGSRFWNSTRTMSGSQVMSQYSRQFHVPNLSQDMIQSPGMLKSTPSETPVVEDIRVHPRQPSSSSSLVNAYYSLGQSAAAAAASQLLFLNPCSVAVSPCVTSQQFTELKSYATALRQRRVDSCTMQKVQNGQFGSLSTLRQYCQQLRCHSAPSSTSDGQSEQTEVAVDLSIKKHSVDSDEALVAERTRRDVVGGNTSRSCDSSPALYKQELGSYAEMLGGCTGYNFHLHSSVSLPSSPYLTFTDDGVSILRQRRRRRHHDAGSPATAAAAVLDTSQDEMMSSDVAEAQVTDVIPDSHLPLKKRRLLYQHHQQQQQRPVQGQGRPERAMSAIKEEKSDDECIVTRTSHEMTSSLSSSSAQEAEKRDVTCTRGVAKILCADDDGDLPLHIAVAKGTTAAVDAIIRIMTELGVKLDYCNDRLQTALHMAVLTDQPDMVCRLLKSGASANIADCRGQTCLHTAVLLNSTSCLHSLLEYSLVPLDLNALGYDGVTALHLAVQRGNVAAVRCLLAAGADVNIVDAKYGRTALFYAVERNDVTMTSLLTSRGANRSQAMYSGSAGYTSKCSSDMLQSVQPSINHRYLPACCPTELKYDCRAVVDQHSYTSRHSTFAHLLPKPALHGSPCLIEAVDCAMRLRNSVKDRESEEFVVDRDGGDEVKHVISGDHLSLHLDFSTL